MQSFCVRVVTLFCLLGFSLSKVSGEEQKLKLLVLIICSDNFPGSPLVFPYKEMQQVWKSYMHRDPEHVEAYFLRADPDLPVPHQVIGDVIWCKTSEDMIPGILNKTLLGLDCMLPRISEFDFILRTNLSSFYVFPRLLNFLKTLPKERCYCGSGDGFGSGCGFLMSSDLASQLAWSKDMLFDSLTIDDVAIGRFFLNMRIKLLPAVRTDILSLEEWNCKKNRISQRDFHFRVKNMIHDRRATEDLYIYSEMLKMFY